MAVEVAVGDSVTSAGSVGSGSSVLAPGDARVEVSVACGGEVAVGNSVAVGMGEAIGSSIGRAIGSEGPPSEQAVRRIISGPRKAGSQRRICGLPLFSWTDWSHDAVHHKGALG